MYEISFIEKACPSLIVIMLLITILIFRNKIRIGSTIDKTLRFFTALISSLFLITYYALEWHSHGITPSNLPLHICFISNVLCIILCLTKNKHIFNFVIFTGVLGGISSLIAPDIHLSFRYFRYYQFMVCHSSIILIPLYFLILYRYKVSFKDFLHTVLITESLGLSLGVFNEIYGTGYMFVSFTSNKAAEGSILSYIGSGHHYFIRLQIIFIIVMIMWYLILTGLSKISFITDKHAHGNVYI